MAEPILIIGASARAAAFSARRAGLRPLAVDMFVDTDLWGCCPSIRAEQYPVGLPGAIDTLLRNANLRAPHGSVPWMYTGALENWPDLIESLSAVRPLLGNHAEVLRRVRDPRQLGEELAASGFRFPELIADDAQLRRRAEPSGNGQWLMKPRRSSGGGGIEVWNGERPSARAFRSHYLQQRVEGVACSAVYVAAGDDCQLLGVTRQLIGPAWAGAEGFRYAGSVGPLVLEDDVRQTFVALGQHLSTRFELRGLFGVDAILCDGQVWTLEVNPRYTASVEILERATNVSALACHLAACRDGRLPADGMGSMCSAATPRSTNSGTRCHGKVILYAQCDLIVPEAFATFAEQRIAETNDNGSDGPPLADIPAAGTAVPAGWPITTLFASGEDQRAAITALQVLAAEVRERFFT